MKTVVDLFAGSGGMSLGLEAAGFTPVFVSELHPDAMGTYLRNRVGPIRDKKNQANDILALTQNQAELGALADRLRREHGEVDLVVGGPPCQGFSGIGHRRTFKDLSKFDIPSNHLYKEMATFIGAVSPKAFVFENVRGLLSARWFKDGSKGEIWNAVQEAFAGIRDGKGRTYRIHPRLLRAADYGVPQNRPRVILIGIRDDVMVSAPPELWHPVKKIVAPDPIDILGDLIDDHWIPGASTPKYPHAAQTAIQELLRTPRGAANPLPKGARVSDHDYAKHSDKVLTRFQAILDHGFIPETLKTKKFNQRAIPPHWPESGPNLTVASLPDDYVHFAQPRACTVREWARLQTFPDWYEFSGRRTTGGRRRAGDPGAGVWTRDLPKYTQIGNAVPVKMAEAIGRRLLELGLFE